jgi:magnesium transporter
MVTALHFSENETRSISIKELAQCAHSHDGVLWVDLEDPLEAEEETLLVSIFDFHPLAIEDCQGGKEEEGHLPKVEDFGRYLFIIFNPVDVTNNSGGDAGEGEFEIHTSQLSAFLTKQTLVTHHYRPLRSIERTAQLCRKNPQMLARGVDYLYHLIIDDIVDNYTPILERLDDALETLEDEVFHEPSEEMMQDILQTKKNVTTIRRVALYQREMLNRLSRGDFPLITSKEKVYYRDVYDHLVRMTDLAESYRESDSALLEAYLSVTSNRLGQVMKVLTIFSAIFLPLGVITGFFGMNFDRIPGLHSDFGVAFTGGFMVLVVLIMLFVFKKRKWI